MSFAARVTPGVRQQQPASWARIMYSSHFLFSLLSTLKTQVKEQGCETEERQSRGNTQQSARWVGETETALKPKQLSLECAAGRKEYFISIGEESRQYFRLTNVF